MEENRRGPGIFYAVVGVATLVVAIIGATFAYFSAVAEEKTVEGVTATQGSLTLAVRDVWPEAGKWTGEDSEKDLPNGLIPLDEEGTNGSTGLLATALNVANKCRDINKDVACRVYEIKVTNGGDASILTSTKLSLAFEKTINENGDNSAANWRWQVINGTEATGFRVATAEEIIARPYLAKRSGTEVTTAKEVGNVTLTPANTVGATDTYYVVVWLEDSNEAQTEYSINFTGTVTAESVDASGARNGVTATFSR